MLFRGDDVVHLVRRRRELLAIAVLLGVALALRVFAVDWDQGHLYHPDERFILMSAAGISLSWPLTLSQLVGPQATLIPQDYSFSYGTFALYLVRLVTALVVGLGQLVPGLHAFDNLADLGNLRLVGRPLSALFDTATVYVIYRLGKQLYGTRVALLGATLVAFSVIDIQLSHFYATDTIMTALVLAAILASVEYLRKGRTSSVVLAGVFAGLALATKASAAPVFAPVVVAQLLRTFTVEDRARGLRLRVPSSDEITYAVETLVLLLLCAAGAFLVAEPYAVLSFNRFIDGVTGQGDMVRGIADLPYTRQYFGRPAYLYFLQNLVLFGAGVPLGLAMVAGWIYLIARNVLRPRRADLVLLAYVLPYFAITGDFWAKFLRYMLPISPLLALFAALALVRLVDLLRSWYLGAHPEDVTVPAPLVVPEVLRVPPELVIESQMEDAEVADLAWLDGETFDANGSPVFPAPGTEPALESARVVASTVEVGEAPVELDEEARLWLTLKGLAFDFLDADDSRASGPATDPREALVDPEARRFAQVKGLSLDWFVTADDESDELAAAPGPSRVDPSGDGSVRDEWVVVAPEEDEGVPVEGVAARPLPVWLAARPGLAAFASGVWPGRLAKALLALVVGFSAFYSLAFDHMYAATSPPVLASQWLYQNAARGSVLATEHWEEGMPVPIVTGQGVDDAGTHGVRDLTMPMYEDDNATKLNVIVSNLVQADYIVFFSNRLYGTVPRIPARYPMSQRYYQKLFGEQLGFKLVEVAERYPNLLGVAFVDDTLRDPGLPTPALLQADRPAPITINLGHADESFSVYDHQRVLIFKKVQRLTPDQLGALIGPPPAPNQVVVANTAVPQYKSLTLTAAQRAVVEAGGTFWQLFNRADLFNRLPLLSWIVLTLLVGLAGMPLGFLAFRFLPDRGYLVAKTLGVLVFVWLSWIVVSLGVVQATRPATLALFVAYLAVGAAAFYWQRHEIVAFVRTHRSLLLIEEAVFWVAFLYDVWVRSLNPDLWHPALGGEKPMDLAYLTAAIRSPIYPPYDPWFAGGYLNYYYFGQIIVGTLIKVSGVIPTTSFNLVIPLLFALTIGGAFSAALALIHRGDRPPRSSALVGGVLAALMVGVLGNLGGFLQLAQQVSQQSPVQAKSAIPGLAATIDFLAGAVQIVLGGHPLVIPEDWYWTSTRGLAMLDLKGTGSINEFPYFTFLFADLHAHLIGLPFTLLALAFCVNVVKSGGALAQLPEARLPGGELGFALPSVLPGSRPVEETLAVPDADRLTFAPSTIAAIGFAGLTAGALFPINSWDYPTYLGLLGLALVVPWYLAARRTARGFLTLALRFAVIVVLSQVLYRPFYANFQSFYSGVHLIDEKSDIRWYVLIHGLFLAIMISYFLVEGWTCYRRMAILRSLRLYVAKWELLPRTIDLQHRLIRRWDSREVLFLYALGALALVAAATVALGMELTGFLLVLLIAALALGLRRDRSPEDCFMVFLFATGLAIGIGTDQVAIDGDVGRMNTIFKFYEQVWVLFGVAGAVALVRLKDRLGLLRQAWVRRVWLGAIVLVFLMASVYPILGTKARVSNRFAPLPPTLDGTAYMDGASYNDENHVLNLASDKVAMVWLQDHVDGTPTILEGTRPLYRWGSRYSIYTGLPTVIGWDWHQKQQRWGYQDQIDQRIADVDRMYQDPSPDATLGMLRSYGVKYIIYGQLEQGFYPAARAKLQAMVGKSLDVAYDQNGVTIYQVR